MKRKRNMLKLFIAIIITEYATSVSINQFRVVKNKRYAGNNSPVTIRARSRLECTARCSETHGCVLTNFRKPECHVFSLLTELELSEEQDWTVTYLNCEGKALISGSEHSVLDSALSASSVYMNIDECCTPNYSRLSLHLDKFHWWADPHDSMPWIQVDLGAVAAIHKLSTRGAHWSPMWIQTYTLALSIHGAGWVTLQQHGVVKLFQANTDEIGVWTNEFVFPVVGRFVRLYPQQFESSPALEWEIYGCML